MVRTLHASDIPTNGQESQGCNLSQEQQPRCIVSTIISEVPGHEDHPVVLASQMAEWPPPPPSVAVAAKDLIIGVRHRGHPTEPHVFGHPTRVHVYRE